MFLCNIYQLIDINFLSLSHSACLLVSNTLYMQTFNEIQKLLGKTNGKVVGDLMTPAPLVVRESTNLEDAARYIIFSVPNECKN